MKIVRSRENNMGFGIITTNQLKLGENYLSNEIIALHGSSRSIWGDGQNLGWGNAFLREGDSVDVHVDQKKGTVKWAVNGE